MRERVLKVDSNQTSGTVGSSVSISSDKVLSALFSFAFWLSPATHTHFFMNAPQVLQSNKALPSLTKLKLPAPPPQPGPPSFSSEAPQLPPKSIPDHDTSLPSNGLQLPPIDVALSNEPLGQGTLLPSSLSYPLMLFASLRPRHSRCDLQPSQPRFAV